MRVTPGMTTEAGGDLTRLADFLDVDGAGVLATVTDYGTVKLAVDSTAYPSPAANLSPDDTDALADLLKMRAREARGVQ
jgi:hypothetical protein